MNIIHTPYVLRFAISWDWFVLLGRRVRESGIFVFSVSIETVQTVGLSEIWNVRRFRASR